MNFTKTMTGAVLAISIIFPACGGDDATEPLADEVIVAPGTKGRPDGSEERPFSSLNEAVDRIDRAADWHGALIVKKGDHDIDHELVVPARAELRVLAGARLAVGPGVSIHAQSDVKIMGTEEEPVTFTWLEEGSHWGSFTNFEPDSEDNVFEWAVFEHGYETNFKGIAMRGALSLNGAKARISHCTFRNNEGDDGLNMKASSSLIEYSTFEDNVSDALDSDGEGSPEIAYSTFVRNGNDGVDLGEGTEPYVHDNWIAESGDKGISNGEASAARILHNVIVGCGVGIGIKDDATPTITYNTLYGNDYGIRIFQEDTAFEGGKGAFRNSIIWGSSTKDILFEFGSTEFAFSAIESIVDESGDPVVSGEGILTRDSGCSDPLFADAANGDFYLKSEAGRWDGTDGDWVNDDETSPCIDKGDPDADVGDEPNPNGSRVNLGAYAGTEHASKSL